VDAQCDKLATVNGQTEVIVLATASVPPTTYLSHSASTCVKHDACETEAARCAGPSATADNFMYRHDIILGQSAAFLVIYRPR